MSRKTGSIVALAAGLLALSAAPASARIVPQDGIAEMKLAMTVDQVLDRKGKPDSDRIDSSSRPRAARRSRYGKTKAIFLGEGDDAELIVVITRKRSERTKGGSGIGTTEKDLVADLPRVRCKNVFGARHCLIGKVKPADTVTDFLIAKSGRVKRVTVAVVTE